MSNKNFYTIGFTEDHGMAAELAEFPGENISYKFLPLKRFGSPILRSDIKGFMSQFDESNCDLIEAILSPVHTRKPWMYSLACYQEAVAFNVFGLPVPRNIRTTIMNHLFKKDNFKNLLFWSEAGKQTLKSYANITDKKIWDKSVVVYPAIREVAEEKIHYNNNKVNILFSGDFFRKGGSNVIDAFIKASEKHKNLHLQVCCDENIDFNTDNAEMKNNYLAKIKSMENITFGRVSREEMIHKVLPNTDIYLLPTYAEAFGFAILEAMAFGIPVISTSLMAIPEISPHKESGFLINTDNFDFENLFKGYVVNSIPDDINNHITDNLFNYLCQLIEDPTLRKNMGEAGRQITREKFSFDKRNETMARLYQAALK